VVIGSIVQSDNLVALVMVLALKLLPLSADVRGIFAVTLKFGIRLWPEALQSLEALTASCTLLGGSCV
jgi:hypothetical protein